MVQLAKQEHEPSVTLDEQMELLSLIGDVAQKDGKPVVHAHAVIGKQDGTAHGGLSRPMSARPARSISPRADRLQKQIDPAASAWHSIRL